MEIVKIMSCVFAILSLIISIISFIISNVILKRTINDCKTLLQQKMRIIESIGDDHE